MRTLHETGLTSTLLADAGARYLRAAIKPLRAGWTVRGRALTVSVPAGDNLAIHAALALAQPGDVLVVDAQGYTERAVMGGIMCAQAAASCLAGVVIDGAAGRGRTAPGLATRIRGRGVAGRASQGRRRQRQPPDPVRRRACRTRRLDPGR